MRNDFGPAHAESSRLTFGSQRRSDEDDPGSNTERGRWRDGLRQTAFQPEPIKV
jgi:hypothetical protein